MKKPCEKSPACLHPVCQKCGRTVRADYTTATDHPGTTKGRLASPACRACITKHDLPHVRQKNHPDRCVECDHPLRRAADTLADYPGTRAHQGRGLCVRCYEQTRAQRATKPRDPIKHAVNVRGLERYLRARKARLARQQRARL